MVFSNNTAIKIKTNTDDVTCVFAKQELERYFGLIFECLVEEKECEIYLVLDKENGYRYDSFSIEVKDNEIIVSSAQSRGILFGAYSLLEKLGCRFIFPGAKREYIPKLHTINLENGYFKEEPCIEHRGLCLYGVHKDSLETTIDTIDWMVKNRFNTILIAICRPDDSVNQNHAIIYKDIRDELLPEFKKRDLVIDMSEHSTDYFFPRSLYLKHPTWFSEQKGLRVPLQMCYSNQNAVAYYAEQYVKFVTEYPEIDIIGIWPLDGGGYCKCKKCQSPYTIVNAMNYIAKAIKKVRPNITVEHLAYTPQSYFVPEFDLEDNMSVLMCSKTDEVARLWAEKTRKTKGAYYFEYNTGDNYRFRSNLFINPEYCKWIINLMSSYGYKGIISLYLPIQAWWQASLNYYFMRLAYWDPVFDINTAIYDLCIDLFGAFNAKAGSVLLSHIFENIQDTSMWNRMPHMGNARVEFMHHRNRVLDKIHLDKMQKNIVNANLLIENFDIAEMNDTELLQLEFFKAYITMQEKYYRLVDQFDYELNNEKQVDEYFDYLAKLARSYPNTFISEEYARWRLVGRDNIFKLNEENHFQPD